MITFRVMSLDVSSTSTGWSFITNRKDSLKYGTIKPDKKLCLPEKLYFFRLELIKIIKKYKPINIVIEDSFVGINPKITKLLAKFSGVAEQVVFEYCNISPYIMSNTTPKSFFKVKKKKALFGVIINLVTLEEDTFVFKDFNDITDSIAQLMCYCDLILDITTHRKETDYGFKFKEWKENK